MSVSSATGLLRLQLMVVDVLCVSIVATSTLYVVAMSLLPVVLELRNRRGRGRKGEQHAPGPAA